MPGRGCGRWGAGAVPGAALEVGVKPRVQAQGVLHPFGGVAPNIQGVFSVSPSSCCWPGQLWGDPGCPHWMLFVPSVPLPIHLGQLSPHPFVSLLPEREKTQFSAFRQEGCQNYLRDS